MPLFEKFRFIFFMPTDYGLESLDALVDKLHAIFDELSLYGCFDGTIDSVDGTVRIVYTFTSYEERTNELIKTVEPICHAFGSEPIFRGVEVYRKSSYDGIFRWKWYYEDPDWFDQPWLFGVVE